MRSYQLKLQLWISKLLQDFHSRSHLLTLFDSFFFKFWHPPKSEPSSWSVERNWGLSESWRLYTSCAPCFLARHNLESRMCALHGGWVGCHLRGQVRSFPSAPPVRVLFLQLGQGNPDQSLFLRWQVKYWRTLCSIGVSCSLAEQDNPSWNVHKFIWFIYSSIW